MLPNSRLTQIPEDNNSSFSNATHVTTSLTPSDEMDDVNVDTIRKSKEEDVNDEPEARLGRLSETGLQLFGVKREFCPL